MREIIEGGISLLMRKIGAYSVYFNKQYKRVGPLFQSRYKIVPITTNDQLSVAFAYVHTNPIELFEPGWKEFEAKNPKEAMRKLGEYRWSSYRDYIGFPTFPFVTHRDFSLQFFRGQEGCLKMVKQWIEYKAKVTNPDPVLLE